MKSKHVTFGSQGQHEFYLPRTGEGRIDRRDRRKCIHYCAESKYCCKIHNQCVGPTICMKYQEKKANENPKCIYSNNPFSIGETVYDMYGKEGKIISVSRDVCVIQFLNGKKVSAKYPEEFEKGFYCVIQNS